METLNKLYDKHFPKITKFVTAKRLPKQCLTSDILNSIKYISKLFKMYKLETVNHNTYKLYRNHLTRLIRAATYD